ncbi:DNA-directed RNA polymerase subunit M/transcription elongation factor TFIIS [Bradyrhizobium sp. CIR18]|nr:DNA-directed RNA polymerase subunit M/transcription elongation factor TFIIS [Bradyrhizobium sp. CIR18]
MSTTSQRILCGNCKSDLTGPAGHTSDSIFVCPTCGASDTYENVIKEAQAYFEEMVAEHLEKQMKNIAQGNESITYTASSRPKRKFRFILDDVPLG